MHGKPLKQLGGDTEKCEKKRDRVYSKKLGEEACRLDLFGKRADVTDYVCREFAHIYKYISLISRIYVVCALWRASHWLRKKNRKNANRVRRLGAVSLATVVYRVPGRRLTNYRARAVSALTARCMGGI